MSESNADILKMLSNVFTIIVRLDDVPYIVYDDSGGQLTLWDKSYRLGNMYVEDVTEYKNCGLTKAQFKRWLKANGATKHMPAM